MNKQYAAAQIGAEGAYQEMNIESTTAERLTEMGVSQAEARQGFRRASRLTPLSEGRGDTATTDQLIDSTLLAIRMRHALSNEPRRPVGAGSNRAAASPPQHKGRVASALLRLHSAIVPSGNNWPCRKVGVLVRAVPQQSGFCLCV